MRLSSLIALAALPLNSCASIDHQSVSADTTTIAKLIAEPEQYFGKTVMIRGYLEYGFENINLWPSRRSKSRTPCNAIGVSSDGDELYSWHRSNVELTGVFEPLCGMGTYNDPDLICISNATCSKFKIHIETIKKI